MDGKHFTPTTPRAKAVHFIWRLIPRLMLLALMALAVVMGLEITKKKASIAAEKEASVSQERPPINTVVYAFKPSEIKDRIIQDSPICILPHLLWVSGCSC